MSGSRVLSQRRHIGLQQLQAITATAHAFLGPNKRLKFIQDEDAGDAVLVGSCPRLLERLELDGAVGQLLHETVQAQQKLFHSGTNTLMFLAGAWSRVALECLSRGISVSDIKTAMRRALQECLDACTQSAVSVEEFKKSNIRSNDKCMDMTLIDSRKFNARTEYTHLIDSLEELKRADIKSDDQCIDIRTTLKHSRHFNAQTEHTPSSVSVQELKRSDIKSDDQCMDVTLKHSGHFNAQTELTHHDVTGVAQAISHGRTCMHLVLKAYELQNSAHLDIQKLTTCCIPSMSEDHSCVVRGYVTLLSVQQTTQVQRLQGHPLNIALIKGDLSENYHHVGFNRPGNIMHIMDLLSTEECWIENAFRILHDFSIDVVFVSGVVDRELKQKCTDILMLEGVKCSVLKHFSTCTGAVPVSYICQLDERCVGRRLRLRKVFICGRSEFVSITADCSVLVTAVICSSVSAKLQMLEDEFWSCAHRLQHALTDGKLLHGAGVTELICIRRLRQYTQLHSDK